MQVSLNTSGAPCCLWTPCPGPAPHAVPPLSQQLEVAQPFGITHILLANGAHACLRTLARALFSLLGLLPVPTPQVPAQGSVLRGKFQGCSGGPQSMPCTFLWMLTTPQCTCPDIWPFSPCSPRAEPPRHHPPAGPSIPWVHSGPVCTMGHGPRFTCSARLGGSAALTQPLSRHHRGRGAGLGLGKGLATACVSSRGSQCDLLRQLGRPGGWRRSLAASGVLRPRTRDVSLSPGVGLWEIRTGTRGF